MLHDWHYLIFRAASSKATKRIADKIFQYGIKRKGKSGYSSWSRRVGLWIATPYLIRRSIKKYGEIRQSDKDTLLKHLQILCPSI
ncbi:MAG: hypothetical protein KDC72_01140 [Bacteroidetes bacterium]|nr:hypothetical protein [Bacteroidota bacterium]